MKFFVAFAALVALTAAVPLSKPVDSDIAQLEAIIAAINSPSTDPATAALLEEQLAEIVAAINPIAVGPAIIPTPVVINPEPIAVGPVIIPTPVVVNPEPIAVGPALLPPKPDLGAVVGPVAPSPVVDAPSPVVIGDIPAGSSPLVQIIVNVNKANAEAVPVAPVVVDEPVNPIVRPEPIGRPEPIAEIPVEPVQVVEVAPIPAEPVQVVEVAPVPVEPVQIGVPIIPEAAVILPEELN